MQSWTQAKMRALAAEERAQLGLDDFEPMDPRLLAAAYGLPVYAMTDLSSQAPAAVAHYSTRAAPKWSAALIPIGCARVILENDTHAEVRRRSSIGHELGHHLLEHPLEKVVLADTKCRNYNATAEKQATFLSGQLLIPERAAKRAAFDGWSDDRVADKFEVSVPFARMRMHGLRVYAERALQKQQGKSPRR